MGNRVLHGAAMAAAFLAGAVIVVAVMLGGLVLMVLTP